MVKQILTVKGMTCGHCKRAVEEALHAIPGVESAEADVAKGEAAVLYDQSRASEDMFRAAIEDAGYEWVRS